MACNGHQINNQQQKSKKYTPVYEKKSMKHTLSFDSNYVEGNVLSFSTKRINKTHTRPFPNINGNKNSLSSRSSQ